MICKLVISVSEREAKALQDTLDASNKISQSMGITRSTAVRNEVIKRLLSEFAFAKKFGPRQSFLTTQDTCDNCCSKLGNAETARRNWQAAAHGLSKRLKELEAELAGLLQAAKKTE